MSSPKNFHLLDLSRFIAAMAVLFWHYQHFYMIEGVSFIRQEQPFYNVFSLLYNYGNIAVQYFWVLSGFVFFFTYSKKISLGKTLPSDYIKNRIARLYPLHILTLIITTVVAYYFNEKNGYYFVYSFNDLKHFILNVFLISHWGLQDGWSYNAPIWSVSVEIFHI
ncbi:acyltransferase family protein [Vibrio crassostreae]|uniref:acyltransferase family protein n=1 Tax=Vibrio crassostreae TaxID=246167 RepID=UPI00104507E9|nr:acyltransferase [Vibrio crassostreae]TCW16931.1 acyltransferase-like protein [Vibrio crassostreae]